MPGRGRAARTEEGCDIFLNDRCCWRDVPAAVWEYTLGGYPVLKKWLSYREKPLLGRGLRPEEVRHFTETARRIAALLALQPELDANYRAVKEFHDPCPRSVNIFPDYGCTYAWDEGGSCLGLAEQWPDIPELADLEENLVAWAETYERAMSGVSEVLEVYDAEDTKRHFTRGKALAQELARLLAPKGVSVSYYGNSIVF